MFNVKILKSIFSRFFTSKVKIEEVQENTPKKSTLKKPRWSETVPMGKKCKQEMEKLLQKAKQNPNDLTLPNTKDEVYNCIGLKKNSAGDFRLWLKYYHTDFYYEFIELFPYFSGRND